MPVFNHPQRQPTEKDMNNADKIFGPWIDRSTLPQVKHQFETNRDPLRKLEIEALAKTEKQRRDEDSRSASRLKDDAPQHNMQPPPAIRDPVDRDMFNARWMREQRNAAYQAVQAHREHNQQQQSKEHQPEHTQERTYHHTR